ncbi:transcription factor TFIIIB subunit brf1 [Tyrophagus putrescentiae]|nr:transcription factor TFIIIB subunit brf1 [Tyrophagus putrescentiae]
MVNICYLCNKGEIIPDKKLSGRFCTGCGECFDIGAFTDEIQYREDDRGRYTAVGNTYNVDKGFVNSKFANHAQLMSSVENARSILKRYCDKLYISEAFSKRASEFYKQLLIKKFMNGRRLNVVLAACLYITVRSEGANVIILDISDVSEANVYEIGRYYFQIVKLLHVNIQTVDPSEYTMRFVDMLRIGNRDLPQVKRTAIVIRDTANRLVQRMKRDWIHYGRRPSGVCAAAVLVACRINNVSCTIKDIISIAKVCESTIRKRINEFALTPSGKLTHKEFMDKELEEEADPPSYKTNDSTISSSLEKNLEKAEKFQQYIEDKLKDSRPKLNGAYAKFLKEVLSTEPDGAGGKGAGESLEDEKQLINEAILDQSIFAFDKSVEDSREQPSELDLLRQFSNDTGNPSTEEIEFWAKARPSAESLGLLKKEYPDDNDADKTNYDDLLSEEVNEADLGFEEGQLYVISNEAESSHRQFEWNLVNKDYLKQVEEENLKRANEDPNAPNKRKKKRRRAAEAQVEASTTSEAVEAAFKVKNINIDGVNLKELFNEEETDVK